MPMRRAVLLGRGFFAPSIAHSGRSGEAPLLYWALAESSLRHATPVDRRPAACTLADSLIAVRYLCACGVMPWTLTARCPVPLARSGHSSKAVLVGVIVLTGARHRDLSPGPFRDSPARSRPIAMALPSSLLLRGTLRLPRDQAGRTVYARLRSA